MAQRSGLKRDRQNKVFHRQPKHGVYIVLKLTAWAACGTEPGGFSLNKKTGNDNCRQLQLRQQPEKFFFRVFVQVDSDLQLFNLLNCYVHLPLRRT